MIGPLHMKASVQTAVTLYGPLLVMLLLSPPHSLSRGDPEVLLGLEQAAIPGNRSLFPFTHDPMQGNVLEKLQGKDCMCGRALK